MACGAAGFFSARPLTPLLQPGGTLAATSFYDTKDLKHTLERLVDFDRLNAGLTRFSAGAGSQRRPPVHSNIRDVCQDRRKEGPAHV